MGIGASVFLIAVGAILAFAVHVQTGFLDLSVVGWILIVAGVIGLIATLMIWGRRRTTVTRTPVAERGRVVEERRVERDPPDVY